MFRRVMGLGSLAVVEFLRVVVINILEKVMLMV